MSSRVEACASVPKLSFGTVAGGGGERLAVVGGAKPLGMGRFLAALGTAVAAGRSGTLRSGEPFAAAALVVTVAVDPDAPFAVGLPRSVNDLGVWVGVLSADWSLGNEAERSSDETSDPAKRS
jgi:hypothetical protein